MPYDWRLNPYQCIKCETRQQACRCCDNGQDSIPFVVVVDGCGTFAGRYEFDAARYKSPTALPAGVSYPATDPCGVFWGTLSAGDGCTANGATWSGSLGLLSWCDGTDAAIPWHVEVFCYNTHLSAWVSQGEATVTSYECRCGGPYFGFTLPELDCCCDGGGELIPTCCCPDNDTPSTLTIEFFDGAMTSIGSVAITYNGSAWVGTLTFCGETDATISLACNSGGEGGCEWTLVTSNGFSNTASVTACNPLSITFESGAVGGSCFGDTITAVVTE